MWLTARSPFGRYSNTLLVSLNNRVSFRDAYCAPEGRIVDLRAVPAFPVNDNRSEPTIETIIVKPEKSQKDRIGKSAEVDKGESHSRHVMVPIFS